jgi:hydrogenase nickel incorporation protein HypA/HybF
VHELAITESVLHQSLAEARKQGATRIRKIKLTVGEGMSVVPECIAFYFDSIKKGTLAAKARLEIETRPLKIRCAKCLVEVKDMIPLCGCNSGVEFTSGQELNIDYIEIDTPTSVRPKPKSKEKTR